MYVNRFQAGASARYMNPQLQSAPLHVAADEGKLGAIQLLFRYPENKVMPLKGLRRSKAAYVSKSFTLFGFQWKQFQVLFWFIDRDIINLFFLNVFRFPKKEFLDFILKFIKEKLQNSLHLKKIVFLVLNLSCFD